MKNLENLNLQELTIEEQNNTEGGGFGPWGLGGMLARMTFNTYPRKSLSEQLGLNEII